jgi:hypothetical protein
VLQRSKHSLLRVQMMCLPLRNLQEGTHDYQIITDD